MRHAGGGRCLLHVWQLAAGCKQALLQILLLALLLHAPGSAAAVRAPGAAAVAFVQPWCCRM